MGTLEFASLTPTTTAEASRFNSSTMVFPITQDSHALMGLMAKYQINPQAEIPATVDNLFDEKYCYPNNSSANHYGEPRRSAVNLKVSVLRKRRHALRSSRQG